MRGKPGVCWRYGDCPVDHVERQEEPLPDLVVGQPLGDELQHCQLALAPRLRTWANGRSRFDDRGNAVRTVGLLAMDDFGVRPVTAPRGRSAVNWSTTGCIQMHDDLFAAA